MSMVTKSKVADSVLCEEFARQFGLAWSVDDADQEEVGRYLLEAFLKADEEGRALINSVFVSLCGWELTYLIEMAEISLGRPDDGSFDYYYPL